MNANEAFYNENEPYAVDWLRNLKRAGHIADGIVDSRSIKEVSANEVHKATQAHFFAGIGGWSHALRLAGWPDEEKVWTGSCPCQPFSTSGRKKGFDDDRHLWPVWFGLISECRPSIIFGEQVASPDGLKWLDLVFSDLEGAGYACAASDLCAAGVGAPHLRQRLYFVAIASQQRRQGKRVHLRAGTPRQTESEAQGGSKRIIPGRVTNKSLASVGTDKLGDSGGTRLPVGQRPEERFGAVRVEGAAAAAPGATSGFWAPAEWWLCRDGKARPVGPGIFPLADGVPTRMGGGGAMETQPRVGRLKAYGNAIVPHQAAIFIRAVMPLIGASLAR